MAWQESQTGFGLVDSLDATTSTKCGQSSQEKIMAPVDVTTSGPGAKGGANIVGSGVGEGPGPEVMAASTLEDTKVITSDGEDVGKISEIMLDVRGGRIVAAVVSTVLVPLTHCADPS